jgi:starch-binding outer membrane protein SusE/F
MKKNLLIYLTFIGLLGLFTGCEEDGTKVVMSANPVVPTLVTLPNLTLERSNGSDMLEFVGTPVDPGFTASATYVLEACAAGNKFADVVTIYSGIQDTSIKITVSDLNGILLQKFPADATSSADFRIRSLLVVDAGTGAPGTSADPMVYSSATKTTNVTTYGLPRLDLINSGVTQKIESALGDGKYYGFVKLDATKAFTLLDPDSGTSYGASGSNLVANGGTGILVAASGWHKMWADVNALTYSTDPYMIGLVGSATPNQWNSPDQKMDYDAATGKWSITIDLVAGDIKFRLNDGWAWNLGYRPGGKDLTDLFHNGDNITVTPGNYTITLTITQPTGPTEAGSCTLVKNF